MTSQFGPVIEAENAKRRGCTHPAVEPIRTSVVEAETVLALDADTSEPSDQRPMNVLLGHCTGCASLMASVVLYPGDAPLPELTRVSGWQPMVLLEPTIPSRLVVEQLSPDDRGGWR